MKRAFALLFGLMVGGAFAWAAVPDQPTVLRDVPQIKKPVPVQLEAPTKAKPENIVTSPSEKGAIFEMPVALPNGKRETIRYRLVRELGQGTFSEAWLAERIVPASSRPVGESSIKTDVQHVVLRFPKLAADGIETELRRLESLAQYYNKNLEPRDGASGVKASFDNLYLRPIRAGEGILKTARDPRGIPDFASVSRWANGGSLAGDIYREFFSLEDIDMRIEAAKTAEEKIKLQNERLHTRAAVPRILNRWWSKLEQPILAPSPLFHKDIKHGNILITNFNASYTDPTPLYERMQKADPVYGDLDTLSAAGVDAPKELLFPDTRLFGLTTPGFTSPEWMNAYDGSRVDAKIELGKDATALAITHLSLLTGKSPDKLWKEASGLDEPDWRDGKSIGEYYGKIIARYPQIQEKFSQILDVVEEKTYKNTPDYEEFLLLRRRIEAGLLPKAEEQLALMRKLRSHPKGLLRTVALDVLLKDALDEERAKAKQVEKAKKVTVLQHCGKVIRRVGGDATQLLLRYLTQ